MAFHPKTESEFNTIKTEAESKNKLIVVDFSATWCGPCKRIAPVFEALAKQTPSVCFIHVDIDQLGSISDASDVSGVPTFKFFKGGKIVERFSGCAEGRLRSSIEKFK